MSKVQFVKQGSMEHGDENACDQAMDRKGIVNEEWFVHLHNVAFYLPVKSKGERLKALKMVDTLSRAAADLETYLDLVADLKIRLVERIGGNRDLSL